ncbi:hypothetical protein ACIQSO_00175 [Pseudomonas putida]|uniref:hypothetical protein n=1 Tax=Pseudomonas putida TaxID=303 RepID=UPI00383AE2A5
MSTLHTQAGNFQDFVKTGVDPRTGQFTLSLALPLPPANQLTGPATSISLSFSILASATDQGYGLGWNFGLSEADLDQNSPRLSLGSGERYAIDLFRSEMATGKSLCLPDQKLEALRVTWQADGSLRIDKKTGESEVLSRQNSSSSRYLLTQMRSPEGRRLYFDWQPFGDGGFTLHQVRDEHRTLLSLTGSAYEVAITLNPQTPDAATLRLCLSNQLLTHIYLPGVPRPFAVEYDEVQAGTARLQLPVRVCTPLGACDSVTWSVDTDAHRLPMGAPLDQLPRVSWWTHSTGARHNELHHEYTWIGEHNFLGFGSDQSFDWHAGRDNLYQVESDYHYRMLETLTDGQGRNLGSIERIWNRFHLLVSEAHRLGSCEVITTTRHGMDPELDWEQQAPWCQLPHEVCTTYIDHARANATRSETTTYRYDVFGNILHAVYPSGIEEFSTYYPTTGAEGCPADPLGMVRMLKRKVTRPAAPHRGAPTLSSVYTYQTMASLIEGAGAHLVIASEKLIDEQDDRVLEHSTYSYVMNPGPLYGRLRKTAVTLNGKTTTTRLDYRLTENELVTTTTTIGFEDDGLNRSSNASAQALLSGQTVWERSESGSLKHYAYDSIGRIVRTTTAVGSPYQTEQLAHYHLGNETALALQADNTLPTLVEHHDVTGRCRRQWLDGDGRVLRTELQDLDHAPEQFREVMQADYDALGRKVRETTQDWIGNGARPALVLTSTQGFDDWGQVSLSVSPDGIRSHIHHDPVTLCSEQWQSHGDLVGPKLQTLYNVNGSPVEQRHLDAEGTLIRTLVLVRDGLDRIIEEHIRMPAAAPIVTRMRHDHYSRIVEKRLPDGTVLSWRFAAHSDSHHPESLTVIAAPEAGQ